MITFEGLDQQMRAFSRELHDEVGLESMGAAKIATTLAAEVRYLDRPSKDTVLKASPVPLVARIEELRAFQAWMELAAGEKCPAIVRAQVIVQSYVCFVYLGEPCFRALRTVSKADSLTRRCSELLTNKSVRAFRNAFAHSSWMYNPDFSGLMYWARKGESKDEQMIQFEVSATQLEFWQALSRTFAYSAFTSLQSVTGMS